MAGWSLVGRSEELELLTEVVTDGCGSVVVAGSVGVGKSALVEGFVAGLGAAGVRTVMARATRSTATIPFGPFVAWVPERAGSPVADRLEVVRSTSRELLAGQSRVVIAVDDAHLLDEGSAALVLHLAVDTPASLVVTVRAGEPCPDAVLALWKDGLAERVDIQPLSEPETAAMVEAIVGGPVDVATRRRTWALTRGVPLYVREVARAATDQGVLAPAGGVWQWRGNVAGSARLSDLVGDQLGRAGPDERRVVDLTAFGEPLPIDVLRRLEPESALADAERHGYVVTEDDQGGGVTVRLGHPLYGEVLRADALRLTARAHAARLVEAALAVGLQERDPLRVAVWLLDGDGDAGPRHADVLLAGADRALALAEWDVADRLARAAEASGAGARAALVRADALAPQQRWDEADALLAALSERGHDEDTGASVAVTRARLLFWSADRAAEALDVVERAAERLAAPARARVLAYGAYLAAFACDPGTAVGWATRAIADAGDVASFRLEALATASLALMLQGRTAEAVGAAEEALPLVPSDLPIDPSLVAVIPAAYAMARVLDGRLAEAAAIAGAAEAVAGNGQVTIVRGLAATLAGRIALCEGRLDAACRSGRQGLDALGGADLVAHWPAAVLATAAAQLGDLATAREALDQAADGVPPVPLYRLELALAQAWFAAASGEVSTARAQAQQAAEDARAAAVWAFELFALLDLARLGAPERAAARLGELAPVVDGAFAAAAAAYACALAARDGAGLDQASVRWEAMGALLLAAEAAATAADIHRAAGLRGAHLTSTARARDLLAACGGARTPPVRDLDADPLLRSLTGREREVVGLAARGLTNRDIAARLYVSVRTVTTHLCHAYAKLGISDREHLPAVLTAAGEDGGPVAT